MLEAEPEEVLEARVAEDDEAAWVELEEAADEDEARDEVAADEEAAEVDEAPAPPAAAPEELELAAAFKHELSDEGRTTRGEA